MGNCKHYRICGLSENADPQNGFCILHSQNPEKDGKAFAEALDAHRKKNGDNFTHVIFPGSVDFSGAKFTMEAYFSSAIFTGRAEFGGAKFHQVADFRAAKFSNWTFFIGVTFTRRADFSNATFTEGAIFQNTTFTEPAVFLFTTFTKDADFSQVKFRKGADFITTRFTEKAHFSFAEFTESASFPDSFIKEVSFSGATFNKLISFPAATFSECDFSDAKFTEGANFSGAKFNNKANFSGAVFTKEPNFSIVSFTKGADFTRVRFLGGGNFQGTTFEGGAIDFDSSSFQKRTLFSCRKEENQAVPIFSDVEVNFRQVDMNPLDVVTFLIADLRKCLFQDTDLRKVQMVGVMWPQIGRRVGVYDEIASLGTDANYPWDQIERLYRELKQNYEDRRNYEKAGDFHYGEEEMRRKNPKTPIGLKFLLTLYWLFSGHSERCVRPLIWIGALLGTSTFALLRLGLLQQSKGQLLSWTSGWDWLNAIIYSLRVMILLKPTELGTVGLLAMAITTIQSVMGPILIGLLTLAIRQKLKR